MEISSAIVGAKSKPYTINITPRMTMNFAAAIPHNNRRFFDDTAEMPIAPPTIPVVFFWHMIQHHAEFWDASVLSEELITHIVHYSEVMELNRPIRSDDIITVTGTVTAIIPHQTGTQIVILFEGRDIQNELIYREYTSGMLRNVSCTDLGKGEETMPPLLLPRIQTEPIREVTMHIDALAAHRYDGCTNIHFPIHTSRAYAKAVGLPEPILQGSCTLALALGEIIELEGEGAAERVTGIQANFSNMVFLDKTIKIQILSCIDNGKQKVVHFQVLNHLNKKAIRNGCIILN